MDVSCPVSPNRVNETVVRIIAFIVVIIGAICLATTNYYALFFLMLDFGLRAFTSGKFSLLKVIAIKVFKAFSLNEKPTDLAPKKFAAALGFIFCLTIGLFYVFQVNFIPAILTIVLLVFAILESIFAVCIGCYLYTFLQMLKIDKK